MSTTPRTDDNAGCLIDAEEVVPADFARTLETELAAAKAECDLNRTRLASIFWSGAMDNYTGGDVQKWAANYTAELARLRADLERFTGHGLLDCHAICDQRDAAVAERDRLREELAVANNWAEHHAARGNDLIAENINHAEAAIRSERLWKEFITLMDITEESDSGYAFNPNKISSCRAMDGKRLNEILNEARQIVFKQ